jgi:hypothetical protein
MLAIEKNYHAESTNVKFDRKHIEKALSSQTIKIPMGLTREQKRAFIKAHA